MKRFLIGLVLLVVVAVAGLLIYVASIDWNLHKDKIAEQFLDATGKQIVFEGPVSFKILPSPYLVASRVKIYNPTIKDQPLVEIPNLVANLELMPLLHKNFEVSRMVLENPNINVEIDDEGRLNWQNDLTPEQKNKIEEAQVKLNSVSLEKAMVTFDDPTRDINFQLENLNGEIIADGMFGPFHVEGNYVKDNNPEGFALSVGKLSDSFSTTLNLVVTHPQSESYIRFDGNFMLANKVLNGNMIVESKKLQDFVKANFKSFELRPEYDYPLALTFDLAANEKQFNLSNMVIKYGETQGAGSMQIPVNDGLTKGNDIIRPRVDMAFNFTDLNLDPVVYTVDDFIKTYKKGDVVYAPESRLDWLVDVKSLRTQYNGQPVKNFETSFDIIDDKLILNSLSAVLPGDTDVKLKGSLLAVEDEPFYNVDLSFNSNDFLKTLNWLNLQPMVSVASTYRKAVGNAKVTGTLQKIQVSPFNLTMDKSSFSGEAGIKLGARPDMMLVVNADTINWDNYITSLPKEEREKSWAQRMQYRFSKLGFLNDWDMQINAKLNLAIYESMPFEKIDFKANLLDGKLEVENLSIQSVANAQMDYSGMLSNFGKTPLFKNWKYSVKTADVAALINKFDFKVPDFDFKQLKNFETQGIVTGDLNRFAMNAYYKLENLETRYQGQVVKTADDTDYSGTLEVKHPDFVKMLKEFNVDYNPSTFSLGLFDFKAQVKGTPKHFKATQIEANIGFNEFKGDVEYEQREERPNIITTLNINKFELDRFLSAKKNGSSSVVLTQPTDSSPELWGRPLWSNDAFNFDILKIFDLTGTFSVADFSYKNYVVTDMTSEVSVSGGNVSVNNLKGKLREGDVSGDLSLNTTENVLSGSLGVEKSDVSRWALSGSKYGLTNGTMNTQLSFNTKAGSWNDIASNLDGMLSFNFENGAMKGWNLQAIYDDILKREVPEGLMAVVKDNLQKGITDYSTLRGKVSFNKGEYNLSDTVLQNSLGRIELFGDGNLPAWNMNVVFNVKYNEPQYLPGYSFSLKGGMNAPLLDVNVSSLFDLYQMRQDKIASDIQAKENAERTRLQGLVDKQLTITETLLADVRDDLLRSVETRKKTVESPDVRAGLRKTEKRLRDEMSVLAEMINNVSETEASEALIAKTTEQNNKAMAEVEKLRKALDKAYLDDERYKMTQHHTKLVEAYNKAKMMMFDFNSAKEGLKSRLAGIITSFTLDDDGNLSGWQQFFDDKAALLEEQNQALLDKFETMRTKASIEEAQAYSQSLADLRKDIETDLSAMEDSAAQYKRYAEEKVAEAEQQYAARLRDEEIKRKVEENTGHISIKKTGRNITVKRDIEEIEEVEKSAEEGKLPILDFSASAPKKAKPTKQSLGSVNVIKRQRVNQN